MLVDHYIDWDAARAQLDQVMEELVTACRLCDIAHLAEDPDNWSTEDLSIDQFIEVTPLAESQIEELSIRFNRSIATLKVLTNAITKAEIEDYERA